MGSLEIIPIELHSKAAFQIQTISEEPYALFGHSLGGLVASQVVQILEKTSHPPLHLILSACSPTDSSRNRLSILTNMPDSELALWLLQIGGVPHPVLEDPYLRPLVFSALRSDLSLLKNFPHPPGVIKTPCSLYVGTEDPLVSKADAEAWNDFCEHPPQVRFFKGSHFYFNDALDSFLEVLSQDLLKVKNVSNGLTVKKTGGVDDDTEMQIQKCHAGDHR